MDADKRGWMRIDQDPKRKDFPRRFRVAAAIGRYSFQVVSPSESSLICLGDERFQCQDLEAIPRDVQIGFQSATDVELA